MFCHMVAADAQIIKYQYIQHDPRDSKYGTFYKRSWHDRVPVDHGSFPLQQHCQNFIRHCACDVPASQEHGSIS